MRKRFSGDYFFISILCIVSISIILTACSKPASGDVVEITPETVTQNVPAPTATPKPNNIEEKGIYDIKKLFVDDNMPKRAEVWYSYYPTIEQKEYMVDAIESGTAKVGYIKDDITENDIQTLYDILSRCGIEVVEEKPVYNTDFYISLEFDDYIMIFNANHDKSVNFQYINDTKDEYTINGIIRSDELFNLIIGLVDKDEKGFSFDCLKDTQSISIKYVVETLNEESADVIKQNMSLDITDSETVSKIVDVICNYSKTVSTHVSNENDDLIFYTQDDVKYLKLKYVGAKEWAETEPTFIVNGYYWFENSELYRLIATLED